MNSYLQRARNSIDDAAGRLDVEMLARKVDARWSIAEILEHLTLAFTATAAALENALASGELRAGTPTLKQTIGRIVVVDVGYFPRVEAPSMTRPRGTIPPERAVSAIREAIANLDATLARIAEKFGADPLVLDHPYLGGMSVRQWRKFHWRHTLHHMKQIHGRTLQVQVRRPGALRH